MSQEIIITNGILNWCQLFEPKQYQGKGEPKYSCDIILPENFDWTALQQAAAEAWQAKYPQVQMTTAHKMPWLDKNLQPKIMPDGPYAGRYFITASSDVKSIPQVVMQNPKIIATAHNRGSFFSGAVVNFWGRCFGYEGTPNGVSIGINGVQLVSDDPNLPRMDNQKNAAEVFQTVPGGPAATAATPGGMPQGMPQGQPQGMPQGMPQGQPQGVPQGQSAGFPAGAAQQPSVQGFPAGAQPAQQPVANPTGVVQQGMPGAGVPAGAPQNAPAGVPGQQPPQGMPWNQ